MPEIVVEQHTQSLEGIGASIDRENSLIRGVKLIGHDSKNGRAYPADVLRSAVEHYQGVRVNVDHPEGNPLKPRSVAERMGMIVNARYVEGRGVYGDFRFNPKHALTEQVLWDAENNPSAVGFSHNASLRLGPKRNGRTVVESIVGVRSVDLVADPATTVSLFEHTETPEETETMSLENVTLDELKAARPDLVTALTEQQSETNELESLRAEIESLKAEKAESERVSEINAQLTEAKLDPANKEHVSDAFLRVLNACESEQRAELIADRAALVNRKPEGKPVTTTVTEQTEPLTPEKLRAALIG